MSSPVILASSSPRRRELLTRAGFQFQVVSPRVIEVFDAHLSLRELTILNALRKGMAVARTHPDNIVVAADTLVALDGQIIGKPANLSEAANILRRLSGRTHKVCSAVFISHLAGSKSRIFSEISRVRFRRLNQARIDRYLAKVDTLDKAGGYAAQGRGAEIIAQIHGSFTNVVGLPMEKTVPALRDFGVLPLSAH